MQSGENKIAVLPPAVVEKIAAGEVVERPASVLKELVENSIDAGAARIDVTVEGAGFSMMRVADDGCGMSRADLGMSVLPHATSKIRSADDLYSIATMGFRGEALASISAVSRMTVATYDGDPSGLGYEISVDGGVSGEASPVSRTRGTTITVRELFYNVPARKKFMKTERGEQMAIIKVLEQLSIPFPSVHFTVTVDGKRLLDMPPAANLLERISQAAGSDFSRGLVECSGDGDGMSVLAYVSTPEKLQAKPRFQSLYVNLRRIDNESVTFAVREAFAKFLGHGNRPAFFCFLDVDPDKIDVNVHPTKQQVKFDNERGVFGFICNVVKNGLRKSGVSMDDLSRTGGGAHWGAGGGSGGGINNVGGVSGIGGIEFFGGGGFPFNAGNDGVAGGAVQTSMNLFSSRFVNADTGGNPAAGGVGGGLEGIGDAAAAQAHELIQCYQIHGIFILVPIKNGILLIDQHAADERVHYERALRDIESGSPVSQQLLFPITLEVSPAEKAVIDSGKKYFNNLGFDISDFGGGTVSISALPAFLRDGEAEGAVREMVRYLLDGRGPETFKEPVMRFAAAFACGAAIKKGQKLSLEEMNALINALFSAVDPFTCPHGRPTLVRISVDELTRRFLR
ncbi:MAG: DNA mismatch repair endonuclease MutL [Chitinispirillales bacterium]|jgi:DNA mismatch repair protein MutL|nr:DNA mismatch repair endonuclease MutL [Chitinispirillales bacterium]